MAWVDPDERPTAAEAERDRHSGFYLRIGTPGGEVSGGTYARAEVALMQRDNMREVHSVTGFKRTYEVIDDDATDPPETGEVEWCQGCGTVAVLRSRELCDDCRGGR